MTKIIVKKIENKGFCAIDNHNKKDSKSYSIIYRSKNEKELNEYLQEKGV